MEHRLMLAAGSMLDCTAETMLDAASYAGFDGVGLRLSGEHGGGDMAAIRRRAESLGLAIYDAEVHRIGGGDLPVEVLLDRAEAVGASHVLAVSDLPDRNATVDALRALHIETDKRGLTLGVEYMAWTTPRDPLTAIEIARDSKCVVLVDMLHHTRVGAGPEELDAVVESATLGWVQVCDAAHQAPGDGGNAALLHEARHTRLAPGRGALPLTELLACLPPDVPISVEVQSDDLLVVAPGDRARLLYDTTRALLD